MKIGIAADNYKVGKFKEELDALDYKYEVAPLSRAESIISVEGQEKDKDVIHALCIAVESHFKRRN
jgi:hypothetical protein